MVLNTKDMDQTRIVLFFLPVTLILPKWPWFEIMTDLQVISNLVWIRNFQNFSIRKIWIGHELCTFLPMTLNVLSWPWVIIMAYLRSQSIYREVGTSIFLHKKDLNRTQLHRDRQTDGQTDEVIPISSQTSFAGGIIKL